jgi:hypothetical protein
MWQARSIGRVFRTCSSALAVHEQRVRLTTPYKRVGKQPSRDFGISLVVGAAELKDNVSSHEYGVVSQFFMIRGPLAEIAWKST